MITVTLQASAVKYVVTLSTSKSNMIKYYIFTTEIILVICISLILSCYVQMYDKLNIILIVPINMKGEGGNKTI